MDINGEYQSQLCGRLQTFYSLGFEEIRNCDSFEDLIGLVEQKTKAAKGFGVLTVYDTSLRIGARKGIYPVNPKEVFIHAGTARGCRALGLDWKTRALPVNAFPGPIRELEPYEIEDFVCIYKDRMNWTTRVAK